MQKNQNSHSVSQTTSQSVIGIFTSSVKPWIGMLFFASLLLHQVLWVVTPASAVSVDMSTVMALVNAGNQQQAIDLVAAVAAEVGGWTPAPGDRAVYDAGLARGTRASVMIADLPPGECGDARLSRFTEGCDADYTTKQALVRFGDNMFTTPQADGTEIVRPVFDDLLSTYIEEVGHSWQEYLFETEGLGQGTRTHLTGSEEARLWKNGWEYQIKFYVLFLDGRMLSLSAAERAELKRNMCGPDSYANPVGKQVAAFGPPPGWPHPEGWPVAAPTAEAHQAFCSGQ